jgi:carbon monoxide dehydrogenase subunit G
VTHVERSIEVGVPVRTAYDQWTQFEDFPRFMSGVQEVRQIGDALTHWTAEIGGVRREWDAAIVEQVPDQKVAWAATTGTANAGAVYFQAVGADRTQVRLALDYEPEGIVERVADVLDVIDRQAVADLDRFKEFIEKRGAATGGWRGEVDDGDVQAHGGAVGMTNDHERSENADVPGDVVAVGPTGGTHGTVTTDPDGTETRSAPVADEGPGVGHSGDPVVVDTQRSSTGTEAGTAGPTADAAGSTSAGVTGFGTDTGMSSDDPASGSFTGDPGARTGSYGGSDDPDSRGETVRTSTGPGERSSGEGGALRAEPGGATADLPEHDVLERDFADRDITEHGGVQRDFANREIDDDEVPSQGFATGQRTLDDPDRR